MSNLLDTIPLSQRRELLSELQAWDSEIKAAITSDKKDQKKAAEAEMLAKINEYIRKKGETTSDLGSKKL